MQFKMNLECFHGHVLAPWLLRKHFSIYLATCSFVWHFAHWPCTRETTINAYLGLHRVFHWWSADLMTVVQIASRGPSIALDCSTLIAVNHIPFFHLTPSAWLQKPQKMSIWDLMTLCYYCHCWIGITDVTIFTWLSSTWPCTAVTN